MNSVENIDVQVKSIRFVVDRPADQSWSYAVERKREHCVLAYVQSGGAIYSLGKEDVHVRKGNVILLKEDQLYTARSDADNPWSFFSVAFFLEYADEKSRAAIDALPSVFRSSDSSQMAENFAELYRTWSTKSAGYLIKCRSLILDILYILLSDEFRRSKASAHYGKIEKIADMMRENYSVSYTLEELCEMTGLSSSHFRMLFKEFTGLSAVQFQNRLKMDRAKDLILSGSCNVTEAAAAVGFNNVYYFSRLFRKLTGKNPSEYLKL